MDRGPPKPLDRSLLVPKELSVNVPRTLVSAVENGVLLLVFLPAALATPQHSIVPHLPERVYVLFLCFFVGISGFSRPAKLPCGQGSGDSRWHQWGPLPASQSGSLPSPPPDDSSSDPLDALDTLFRTFLAFSDAFLSLRRFIWTGGRTK